MNVQIPSFRVPLIDQRTGLISREWFQFLFQLSTPILQRKMESGIAAPTDGTWTRGDIVLNIEPSAGGIPGWVCITSGTPGTWKAMADLAA